MKRANAATLEAIPIFFEKSQPLSPILTAKKSRPRKNNKIVGLYTDATGSGIWVNSSFCCWKIYIAAAVARTALIVKQEEAAIADPAVQLAIRFLSFADNKAPTKANANPPKIALMNAS